MVSNNNGLDFKLNRLEETFKGLEEEFSKLDLGYINEGVDKILFALKRFTWLPDYVMSRALYTGDEKVYKARFGFRLGYKNSLKLKDIKKVVTIGVTGSFFSDFLYELKTWFSNYEYYAYLEKKVSKLNKEIDHIVNEINHHFKISFAIGEGILDISNKHIVIGLSSSHKTVSEISNSPLFDDVVAARRISYIDVIKDSIVQCILPYDIIKLKTQFTQDFGFYTRKSVHKLLRGVAPRREGVTRVGVCYADVGIKGKNVFAVVEKKAFNPDLISVVQDGAIVVDNVKATSVEKKAGESKILIEYRLNPFDKSTGEPVLVDLADILCK